MRGWGKEVSGSTTVPSTIVTWKKSGISLGPRDISQDNRNKTSFMLLYYSYSRPLREARGNHCHTFIGTSAAAAPPPPVPSSRTGAGSVYGANATIYLVFVRPRRSGSEARRTGGAGGGGGMPPPPHFARPRPSSTAEVAAPAGAAASGPTRTRSSGSRR